MSTLNRAIEIATKAHERATDKYGSPYINHVTRVMNMGETNNEKIVGVLHDVIEDTHWTFAIIHIIGKVISGVAILSNKFIMYTAIGVKMYNSIFMFSF